MKKAKYLLYCLLSLFLAACESTPTNDNKHASTNSLASKSPASLLSRETISLRGQKRQALSLNIGGPQKDTIIFYFTGSGCHDISYSLQSLYGRLVVDATLIALVKKGVRAKSTGKTCSDEFVNNDSIGRLVDDASSLMNHYLQRGRYKNIVVAGQSEGGDIIWRLAERIPAITHVFSMHRGLGMNNLDELKVIAQTKYGQQRQTYYRLISDLEGRSNFYNNDDFILIRKKRSWLSSVYDRRNPARVLLRSGKKVLIMMGDRDRHVPIRSMFAAKEFYCNNGNNRLIAIAKKGYGHSVELNTPERAVELKVLARWLSGLPFKLTPPFQRLECFN